MNNVTKKIIPFLPGAIFIISFILLVFLPNGLYKFIVSITMMISLILGSVYFYIKDHDKSIFGKIYIVFIFILFFGVFFQFFSSS